MAIMPAKLENCFILFNNENVLGSSYTFNSKALLKARKNTDFFCLVIYLKETEPGQCSDCLRIFVLIGKRWKYGK